MKTRLASDADQLAMLQVCGLSSTRSPAALLAALSHVCMPEENFEVIIAKDRLASTFRANPSLLAKRILEKCYDFNDSAGFYTPGAGKFVTIILFRERRPPTQRRYHPHPSVLQVIKNWHNDPQAVKVLEIPIEEIPAFYLTHSEQLTYKIWRETNTRINIKKLKFLWKITHQ